MRPEFRSALVAARQHDNPSDRIDVVKRAVANEVSSVDPTVRARFTDYFNHSVAPDIVLQWPSEDRERLLFVRPTGHAGWLLNDMRFLTHHQPMVFTLEDLGAPPNREKIIDIRESLGAAAEDTGTWITDSSGTEAMSRVRKQSPTLGLLSQALVRGGRGVSDEEDIAHLTSDVEAGFAGASRLSFDAAHSAVTTIESHLAPDQSGRLTRLLRAVWEGHGGDSAQFPPTATVGNLTEDDLSYLLETTSEGTADFWRRLGRAINTAMLGRVGVADPSSNLQALMLANLETLQAKGVRLLYEPLRLSESEQTPRWLVAKGCLALRGHNWTAYVAARLIEEFPPPDPPQTLDLATLRSRAEANPAPITHVRLRRGDRVVTYESKEGGNVLSHPGLSKAAVELEVTDIEGVVAAIPGSGNLGVDFTTSTASGATSATFPLGSLMRFALPLLADLSPDEHTNLSDALKGEGYQDTLFPTRLKHEED